jgi:hypothetical protein
MRNDEGELSEKGIKKSKNQKIKKVSQKIMN